MIFFLSQPFRMGTEEDQEEIRPEVPVCMQPRISNTSLPTEEYGQ